MVENDTASDDCVSCDSGITMLEPRPYRPFKTSEEYLYAMKEDLADWLNNIYNLDITVDSFMEVLETGTVLCEHANGVRRSAEEFKIHNPEGKIPEKYEIPDYDITYRKDAKPGTFFARDNIHNFISWCRKLKIMDCLLFETDDLVLRKNEKSVILCLLEVARRGAKFGMLAPLLVQFEQEIDRDIAKDQRREDGCSTDGDDDEVEIMEHGPFPQIVTNDLRSLDEMVRDLVARCSCPSQFPMIKVSEGKYRVGDTKTLIYVRILRNHVMVRVGGGWDTLEHYLEKHDPCRCRSGHRTPLSTKFVMKRNSMQMQVEYERSSSPTRARRFSTSSVSSGCKTPVFPNGVAEGRPAEVDRSLASSRNSSRRSSEAGFGSLTRNRRDSGVVAPKSYNPRSRDSSLSRLGSERLRANSGSWNHSKSSSKPQLNGQHDYSVDVRVADEIPSGDSGSEVSDEGYKSGCRLPTSWTPNVSSEARNRLGLATAGYPVDQRQLNACNLSCDSGAELQSWEDSIDGISSVGPTSSNTPTSRRDKVLSRIPLLAPTSKIPPVSHKYCSTPVSGTVYNGDSSSGNMGSTSSLQNCGLKLTRSMSASSENGFCFGFSRNSPARHSHKPKTECSDSKARSSGKNTWSGRIKERGELGPDLFRNPNKPPSRCSSVSPHPERKVFSSLHSSPIKYRVPVLPVSLPTSPNNSSHNSISPLLQKILKDPDNDNDEKIFLKVETILNQYRASLVNKLELEGLDVPSDLKKEFSCTSPSKSPVDSSSLDSPGSDSELVVSEPCDSSQVKEFSSKLNYKKPLMNAPGSKIPVPTFY